MNEVTEGFFKRPVILPVSEIADNALFDGHALAVSPGVDVVISRAILPLGALKTLLSKRGILGVHVQCLLSKWHLPNAKPSPPTTPPPSIPF